MRSARSLVRLLFFTLAAVLATAISVQRTQAQNSCQSNDGLTSFSPCNPSVSPLSGTTLILPETLYVQAGGGDPGTLTCTPSGVVTSCTLSSYSFTTNPDSITVTGTLSNSPGPGSITVSAGGAQTVIAVTATPTVTVAAELGPKDWYDSAQAGITNHRFLITNHTGSSQTYNVSLTGCSANACTLKSPTSVTVNANSVGFDSVTYNSGNLGQTFTGTFTATQSTNSTQTSSVTVTEHAALDRVKGVIVHTLADHGNIRTGADTTQFTVTNKSRFSASVNLTATCSGAAFTGTCTVLQGSPVTIGAGSVWTISVISTGSSTTGATGYVKLVASPPTYPGGADSAITDVILAAQAAPGIVLQTQGGNFNNSDCLTVSIQPGVAYACGDLRIVHPLPAAWTYNKKQQPVLIYRPRTARPTWMIRGLVTLDPARGTPDSVTAILVNTGAKGKYAGSEFANGATRQVALEGDFGHNIEPEIMCGNCGSENLQVNAYYGATNIAYNAVAPVMIDYRDTSKIGPGWGIAGLEHISLWPQTGGAPNWIWYGGDGSIRQYGACCGVNTPRWVAAVSLDRPDSMIRVVDSTQRVTIRRLAPHGVQVVFDSATGRQIATIDRLKHVTQFYYHAGTYIDLDSITAPAPGGRHLTWKFVYDSTGYLSQIVGPPVAGQSRTVTFLRAPTSHVLTQIDDPDGTSEWFTYSAYNRPSDPGVIVSYKDKLGTPTVFTYDSTYFLRRAVRDTGAGHIADTLQFTPAETRGAGIAGQVTSSASPDSVYTLVNGPRTNVTVTKFWVDGYGEPVRIRDALGYESVLTRGDTRWKTLVTRVRYPNGQVESATYDVRGNVATETDSSTFATVNGTMTYATDSAFWDQTWDFATRTVSATGLENWFKLDPTTGNRIGQLTHTTPDTAGDSRWIRFGYDPTTLLLSSVSTSITQPARVFYDTLGNVQGQTTSLGYWTTFFRDNVGRDTLVVSTIDSGDFVQYPVSGDGYHHKFSFKHFDEADRVMFSSDSASEMLLLEVCHGGQFHAPSLALDITTRYNANGTIANIDRVSSPDSPGIGHQITQWRYDALGRSIVEIPPDGTRDSVVLDKSGNSITRVTRMGSTLTATYDALNHPTMKIVPTSLAHDTSTAEFGWYPRYDDNNNFRGEMNSNPVSGIISVPADTQTFTYDAVGNMRTAFNREAHVSRTYNPNGTLATDTLRVRTYAGIDFLTHVYGLSYSYDLDKRRTAIHQPGTLTYVAGDSESFTYDQTTGNLLTSIDVRGNSFLRFYDPIDRVTTVGYFQHGSNQSVSAESFAYTGDGYTLSHQDFMTLANGSDTSWTTNQLRADTIYSHDARGKGLLTALHFGQLSHAEKVISDYDGLGQLAAFDRYVVQPDPGIDSVALFQVLEYNSPDAFGNEGSVNLCLPNGNGQVRTYQAGTGRITFQRWADDVGGTGSVAHEWDNYNVEGDLEFQRRDGGFERGASNDVENDESVNFYGADAKLHYVDRRNNYQVYADSNNVSQFVFYKYYFDEYRYDALGRRVMRRSRANSDCLVSNCFSTMQRFVYDGDDLLWEISRPGWDTVSMANLEADTTQVQQDSRFYGRLVYLNGENPERPLDIVRYGLGYPYKSPVGFHLWGPQVIIPHYDWHDQPDYISFEAGQQHSCLPNPNHGDCVDYRLPDGTNAFLHNGTWPDTSWLGITLNGVTENQGSGLQYKRNRFYDPVTGIFTQEDPAGLAGGLNAYGFAGGDPVSYRDPQGTCGPICFVAISVAVGAVIQGGFAYYHAVHAGANGSVALNAFWHGAVTGALSSLAFSTALVGINAALAPEGTVTLGPTTGVIEDPQSVAQAAKQASGLARVQTQFIFDRVKALGLSGPDAAHFLERTLRLTGLEFGEFQSGTDIIFTAATHSMGTIQKVWVLTEEGGMSLAKALMTTAGPVIQP